MLLLDTSACSLLCSSLSISHFDVFNSNLCKTLFQNTWWVCVWLEHTRLEQNWLEFTWSEDTCSLKWHTFLEHAYSRSSFTYNWQPWIFLLIVCTGVLFTNSFEVNPHIDWSTKYQYQHSVWYQSIRQMSISCMILIFLPNQHQFICLSSIPSNVFIKINPSSKSFYQKRSRCPRQPASFWSKKKNEINWIMFARSIPLSKAHRASTRAPDLCILGVLAMAWNRRSNQTGFCSAYSEGIHSIPQLISEPSKIPTEKWNQFFLNWTVQMSTGKEIKQPAADCGAMIYISMGKK